MIFFEKYSYQLENYSFLCYSNLVFIYEYHFKSNFMLKAEILLKIRQNKNLKNQICLAWDISPSTLSRWLINNDPVLTRWDRLQFLASNFGLEDPKDLLESSVSHFN